MTDTPSKARPTIVIAEDDDLLAELMEFKLGRSGYAVERVGDGEEALALVRDRHPDVVILDGMLPGMDGFDVLREIKENPDTREIPVMMLTGRKLERDIVSGLALGADEYLVKPFMLEELLMRLRRLARPGTAP